MRTVLNSLIALTAALTLHTTATFAAVFTTNATIGVGIPTYDGQDIVVSNCTLTVNGPHPFNSLLVMSNGVVTHTADPDGTIGNRLDLTILNDATVALGGAIQADGRGYAAGQGPGAGWMGWGSSWCSSSGAGHGGVGGLCQRIDGATVEGGGAYGSVLEPTTKGSGSPWGGGAGGGVIRLTVGGTLTVNGQIRAAGNSAGGYSGGGSGGSVWLTVGTLSGTGGISVNGGNGGSPYGGGGAGGRLAVYHTNNLFAGTLSAQAGAGYQTGGAGTIYTKASSQAVGSVLVDNSGNVGTLTPLSAPAPFALTIAGQALVYPETNLTLRSLVVASNGTLFHLASQPGLDLTILTDATVALGGAIQADGRGYAAGQGPGAGWTGWGYWCSGSGAGHGGVGGLGQQNNGATVGGGGAYGSVLEPTTKGSGGGWGGGAGGGVIRLTVGGTLIVNGQISAAGNSVSDYSGGGAGGSLWLTVGTLSGTGVISVNGANGGSPYGGGGAGGRIAVYHTNNLFTGALSAQGGTGYQTGGAGTIYTKAATQEVGEVLVYNPGTNGAMTPLTTPEPFNLTIAGLATAFPETALIVGNMRLTSGATLTHLLTQLNMDVTVLHDATIEPGGVIRTDGLGNDPSPGAGGTDARAWYAGGGAGHGGVGGMGDRGNGGTVAGGIAYGLTQWPTDKGSRGGWSGGMGGGAIRLNVGGTLTVNGQISADGNSAIGDTSGGGSGGSLWLTVGTLSGTGVILAIGGNGNVYGGGGAGGRIAVYHTNNLFTGILSAQGGTGYQTGGDGSRYFLSGYLPLVGTGHAPAGTVMYAVSNVDVYFNVAVNPATVTTNDVTITTPGGPIPANQLAVEMLGGTQLRLRFPPQNVPGTYQVQVGPQIEDLYGNAIVQPYAAAFTIAAPLISGTVRDTNGVPVAGVALQPGGGLNGAVTAIDGQYSLPVLASWTGTVTPSKPGWMFVPGARSHTNLTANVTNQNYTIVETIASALSSRQQGTDCHVEWYGLSGVGYQPQSSTNLVNWADYGSLQNGTNGPLWFNVPLTSTPQMFFRIRSDN